MLQTPSELCLGRARRYGFPLLIVQVGPEVRAYSGPDGWEVFAGEAAPADVDYAARHLSPGMSRLEFRGRRS